MKGMKKLRIPTLLAETLSVLPQKPLNLVGKSGHVGSIFDMVYDAIAWKQLPWQLVIMVFSIGYEEFCIWRKYHFSVSKFIIFSGQKYWIGFFEGQQVCAAHLGILFHILVQGWVGILNLIGIQRGQQQSKSRRPHVSTAIPP